MAIQNIAIGTPGAGGGDPAHAAFTKINQNFSNPQHAASRMVGTGAGNVMEVGAFGVGTPAAIVVAGNNPVSFGSNTELKPFQYLNFGGDDLVGYGAGPAWGFVPNNRCHAIVGGFINSNLYHVCITDTSKTSFADRGVVRALIRTTANTWVDGNGFIKAASPVVKLFADKIEPNDEAQLQEIAFKKLGIGDYLIQGSSGFAEDGWYIEMPKDANGNVLVAVVYEQLENNDISVKTYAKKFDDETGDIVANLTKPRDIPAGRCIDLRLQELPQPELQIPESIAPPDFQPTGLAEAVATVMESYHDPEQ